MKRPFYWFGGVAGAALAAWCSFSEPNVEQNHTPKRQATIDNEYGIPARVAELYRKFSGRDPDERA